MAKRHHRAQQQALSKAVQGVGLPELPTVAINKKAQEQVLSFDALFGAISPNLGPTRDRIKLYPATGLHPQKLVAMQRQADLGVVYQWQELLHEAQKRDGRLKALRRGTEVAITGRPWSIRPCDDSPEAAAMCAFVQETQEGSSGWGRSTRFLLGARCGGFAGVEPIFRYRTAHFPFKKERITMDALAVDEYRPVHGKHFAFNTDNTSDEPIKGAGRVLQVQGQTPMLNAGAGMVYIPPAKMIFNVDTDDGLIQERGWGRAAIWLHMLKQKAISQWGEFINRFGVPNVRGSVPYNIWADKKRMSMYARFLQIYGEGLAVLFPDDLKVNVDQYQPGGTSRDAFGSFIGWVDTQYAVLVQGEHLTTEIGDTGSYNAASEQALEKVAVVQEMHETLCETLRRFWRLIIFLNRAELAEKLGVPAWLLIRKAPVIAWRLDAKTTRKERLEEMALYVNQLGGPLRVRQAQEEGGFDPPAPGEALVHGAVVQVSADAKAVTTNTVHDTKTVDNASPATTAGSAPPKLELTATDLGVIITVNEARASKGMGPLAVDGDLTIAEYKAKHAPVVAQAAAADDGKATGGDDVDP